jgi:hypothetical protein
MSSFLTLIIQILPLAFGAAVSPTALMGIIILLSISKKTQTTRFWILHWFNNFNYYREFL